MGDAAGAKGLTGIPTLTNGISQGGTKVDEYIEYLKEVADQAIRHLSDCTCNRKDECLPKIRLIDELNGNNRQYGYSRNTTQHREDYKFWWFHK